MSRGVDAAKHAENSRDKTRRNVSLKATVPRARQICTVGSQLLSRNHGQVPKCCQMPSQRRNHLCAGSCTWRRSISAVQQTQGLHEAFRPIGSGFNGGPLSDLDFSTFLQNKLGQHAASKGTRSAFTRVGLGEWRLSHSSWFLYVRVHVWVQNAWMHELMDVRMCM